MRGHSVTIPAAAELDIYDRSVKEHQARLAVSMGPDMWTALKLEGFSTPLSAVDFWYTQFGGDGPVIESDTLKFHQYGGPPREMVITRKHWFPEATDLAFKVTIIAQFNTNDPVYQAVITVGGIEQTFGVEGEPARIIQKGSGYVSGANIGRIFINGAGTTDAVGRANNQAQHIYVIEWDPDASGVGSGNHKLTVRYDGTIVAESSAEGVAVQPRYVAFGMIQSTRKGIAPPGLVGVPFPYMLISSLTTEEDGDGYESPPTPAWTSTDLGNTIDTATDGERFTMDSVVWAKVPQDAIRSVEVQRGRQTLADTISISLDATHPTTPETVGNRFIGQRWIGRTVLFDTRVLDEDGNATDWRRQIAAEIEDFEVEDGIITLMGRERPMQRLDTFISRSYLDISGDADQQGEIEGTNVGFELDAILRDLVEVSDLVAGGLLGATASSIQTPSMLPRSLSSGGQSLLPVFAEWCDRLVLECWRRYTTSGAERYGQIRVNLWTFGDGAAGYTFCGQGSALASGFENAISANLKEGRRDGTGQAFYRQENPTVGDMLQSIENLPTVGQFPSMAYPVHDRVINDSLAYIETTGLSVLTTWPAADGTPEAGGVARHRYRRENAMRRRLALEVEGHDWLEPSDEIALDDPDGTGVLEGDETWIVTDFTVRWEGGRIVTQVECLTANWVRAIVRGL